MWCYNNNALKIQCKFEKVRIEKNGSVFRDRISVSLFADFLSRLLYNTAEIQKYGLIIWKYRILCRRRAAFHIAPSGVRMAELYFGEKNMLLRDRT